LRWPNPGLADTHFHRDRQLHLFRLDAIADELEDPFGRDENDLPTDAIVRNIERDVLEALGVTELPPQLEPVDFVLN
jgi:putative membrane protein